MRQHMAASALLKAKDKYNFGPEQIEELQEKADTALNNARAALAKAYRQVSVPVRDRSGAAPYRLDEVDLRTIVTHGRSLSERVHSALESHVFNTLVAAKLVSPAGLGPERRIVSCADLVDWFYSYFDFTKLWDRTAIARAISDSVAASEAGYAMGHVRHGDTPALRAGSTVCIGEHLDPNEIDLTDDAAIVWADYAHQLAKPDPGGAPEPPTPGTGAGPSTTSGSGQSSSTPPGPAGPGTSPMPVGCRGWIGQEPG